MNEAVQIAWPRRVYRRYFAKYPLCRAFKDRVVQIYYDGLHLRSLVQYKCHHAWQSLVGGPILDRPRIRYGIVSMDDFLEKVRCRREVFAKEERVTIPGPKMYGECPVGISWSETVTLPVPKVEVLAIPRAKAVGKSDFILHENMAVYPNLFDPHRDISPEEVHELATIHLSERKLRLRFLYLEKMMNVDAVISLLGGCTGNYVHWLTETLPKLLVVDSMPEYRALPLLVDEGLPPTLMESLERLNIHGHPIVPVKRWQPVRANKIIAVTPTAYTPFEYQKSFKTRQAPDIAPTDTVYAPSALRALAAKVRVTGQSASAERLFIRRSSAHRHLLNFPELAELLKEQGFEEVIPEALSFSEQAALFSGAETIVAQAGAALGNMLFAPAGCKVIALTSYTPYSNYYYFSNMAGILGHELRYVLGKDHPRPGGHPAHGDVTIDPAALREALS